MSEVRTPCVGPCNLRGLQRTRAVAGDPIWCRPCALLVQRRLLQLPGLVAATLANGDGHRAAPDAEPVTRTKLSPPSPSPAFDRADALYRDLIRYRELFGDPQTVVFPYSAENLAAQVSWMQWQFTEVMALPDSGAFGWSVHRWHGQYIRATHTGNDPVTLTRPCPVCETKRSLQAVDGEDLVTCTNCDHEMNRADYEMYDRAMATWEASDGQRADR